ncbi:MAG: hypothetical protein OEY85_13465, partial [Rhodospirillales bacterium]|nr:hypothetical protein [Rhodospirillales bacterium]
MSWFKPKHAGGESMVFRRGAVVSVTGLAGVVVIFATTSGAMTEGMQWPVAEIAIMGLALAALPVAFFASRLRLGLEPGEARPMRLRTADYWVPRLIGLLVTPFLSLATSFVIWRIHQRSGIDDYATEVILAPSQWVFVVGAGLATFLGYQFLFEGAAGKLNSLFLTDRRLIRFTPGFWRGRVETLALEDVAEIRENSQGITLIAASRDAMRRLRPDGTSEAAGIDQLHLPLSRFRFPWAAKTQYDRTVALLGRATLRWHAPSLPRHLQRLVSLEAKYWDIVAVLAVIPMLVFLVVAFSTPDTPRIKEAVA